MVLAPPAPVAAVAPVAPIAPRAAAVLLTAALLACGRPSSPEFALVGTPHPTAVELRGLSNRDVAALASMPREQWPAVFPVQVAGGTEMPPIAGEYVAHHGHVRFIPMYGFDKGRRFSAVFYPARIPGAGREEWRQKPIEFSFSSAAAPVVRSTIVQQVYPSGDTLPENMLRFYLEFSAPMGRGSALEHIRLEDESGKGVAEPFLPVEADFWDPQRTRFTLFFDPGRVKRGIKPNRDMGRALVAGKRYTLVVDERWVDAQGQMLRQSHRRSFTAGRAEERALDTAKWKIAPPRPGTRDPVVVTFPWALDYGLLHRALTVHARTTGSHVVGDIAVAGHETEWMLTPRDAWAAGDYMLRVQTLLEDPAGNRIGRAFEVTKPVEEAQRVEINFTVR